MPDSNQTVDAARNMLEERRKELHAELQSLEKAISALGGKVAGRVESVASKATGRRRRGPGRPRGSKAKSASASATATTPSTSAAPRQRRRRKGGTRGEQAVKLIASQPGLSASEIATKLGIKPNYMYRVLGELEADGKIRKDGRSYHPA